MKIFVIVKKKSSLPETEELAFVMWDKNISFSKIGNHYLFKKCTSLLLSWDKSHDDPRWKGHPKLCEYIEFEIKSEKYKRHANISIEIPDDAVFVDTRAAHKAALFLAEKCDGKISVDGDEWVTSTQYFETVKNYLHCNFSEAVERSLKSL